MLKHTNFLTMISINLDCCYEMLFTQMNTWMIGKNSMIHYYMKKESFYSHLSVENITDADYTHVKRVFKDSEIKKT